jgi:RimJ/RimL family protein N-acetyltransferase
MILLDILKLVSKAKFHQIFRFILRELSRRIYSDEIQYGFHFHFTKNFVIPEPINDITIRKMRKKDISKLFYGGMNDVGSNGFRTRLEYLLFIHAGIPTCYVGVTDDETPCVACCLFVPEDNDKVQSYFKSGLPRLKSDEAICEHIFTNPVYRGQDLMRWMTLSLFRKASEFGARRAIAFVHANNRVSLKTSLKIGWEPYIIKKVSWRFFKRRIAYLNL